MILIEIGENLMMAVMVTGAIFAVAWVFRWLGRYEIAEDMRKRDVEKKK